MTAAKIDAEKVEGDRRIDAAACMLRRNLLLLAVMIGITAYFSETYFHTDEHHQIFVFVGYKLGLAPAADLPWEFHAHIRPWMQPAAYFLIAKALNFFAVRDLFAILFVLRLVTGIGSVAALCIFARAALAGFATDDEKLAYARSLPVFGFLPYLFVRTSSETVSAALIAAALALVWQSPQSAGRGRLATAGLLLGFAFECRYQSGILILGLAGWLAIVARLSIERLALVGAAALVPVVFAVGVDRWGYGFWCFPPWDYLRENVIEGAALRFGTDPLYAYPYLIAANIFLPIAVVLTVSTVVVWIRRPWHIATWTTLPFVIVHSLIGHKEERFLFPLSIVATAFPVLAFAPSGIKPSAIIARCWALRRSLGAKIVMAASIAAMLLLAIYPFGFRPHLQMAKYIYENFPDQLTAYSFDTSFHSYPMYRPSRFEVHNLSDASDLESLIGKGPVYVLSDGPELDPGTLPQDAQATMLYSELPFAAHRWAADAATRLIGAYKRIEARQPRLPHLSWLTLYRVERTAPVAIFENCAAPCAR